MSRKLIAAIGGLAIGVVVTRIVLFVFKISVEAYGSINLIVTSVLFGLVGIIGLDSVLKAGFLTN